MVLRNTPKCGPGPIQAHTGHSLSAAVRGPSRPSTTSACRASPQAPPARPAGQATARPAPSPRPWLGPRRFLPKNLSKSERVKRKLVKINTILGKDNRKSLVFSFSSQAQFFRFLVFSF